jgi:flagellar hook protein FlgE
MYTGLTGLTANGEAMAVVGDNIANLSTTGFKYSQVNFEDLMASMVSTGSGPGQCGRGTQISQIVPIFSQGSMATSANDTDVAITGTGFFIVKDPSTGNLFYTRAGAFNLDLDGNLVNPQGYRVQGKVIDAATGTPSGTDVDIVLSQNYAAPRSSTSVDMVMNLDSNTTAGNAYTSAISLYDSQGNIHSLNMTYTKLASQVDSTVTCSDATALNSHYWTISSPTTGYYVWYNVGGAGVDPAVAGRTGVEVAVAAGATAAQVAAATQAALSALPGFTVGVSGGNVVSISSTASGSAAGAADVDTGWAIAAATNDGDWLPSATLDGNAVTISDVGGGGPSNMVFNTNGTLVSAGQYSMDLSAYNIGDPVTHLTTLNLKNTNGGSTTQYAAASVTNYASQDGYGPGFLQRISISTDGIITGHYSNGQIIPQYQFDLARFNAPIKLHREGSNLYSETQESGVALTGSPQSNGLGSINANSLEQSNVDLGNEFVDMILYQRAFQANSRIITTSDTLLEEVLNLKR